ncbi:unnamed protein product [Symbiodinium sp. CCMP2592]|nr:unnamed protein product [Symbiodinium sp. CCMP2592]
MLSLAVLVTCIFKCQAIEDYGTADVYDLLIQKQDGAIGVSHSRSSLGARTVELLRNGQQAILPVKDVKELVDCSDFSVALSCPEAADKEACQRTVVEYDGVRYVCFFTEITYGSISSTLHASRCNVDMRSSVCKAAG